MRGLSALTDFLSEHLGYDQYRQHFMDDLVEILQDHLGEDQDAVQLADRCDQNEQKDYRQGRSDTQRLGLQMDEILHGAKAHRVEDLVHEYAQRRPCAIKLVDQLLVNANLGIDGLIVDQRGHYLDAVERLDCLITVAERRRTALAEALRRDVQEIETEYEVIAKTSADSESVA